MSNDALSKFMRSGFNAQRAVDSQLERGALPFPKPVRMEDPDYRRFIRRQPCVVCGPSYSGIRTGGGSHSQTWVWSDGRVRQSRVSHQVHVGLRLVPAGSRRL